MHYRHLKKICQRKSEPNREERIDIILSILEEKTELTGFALCLLDLNMYMYMANRKFGHFNEIVHQDVFIGGSEKEPILYFHIYSHEGHFSAFAGLDLVQLSETLIKKNIKDCFYYISYSEIMTLYRRYLYNDLKTDEQINKLVIKKNRFHLQNSRSTDSRIADMYTTDAILEYNRLKHLRYGRGFDKKVCSSSKRKKPFSVHV